MSKPTDRPNVPCHTCNGKGLQPMPDRFWKILVFMRRMKKVTSTDIQELMPAGSHPTLSNKRLDYLLNNGFATRVKEENTRTKPRWIYSPTQ